ncbi:MAG TPA: hydrogenase expression/formation protein HypE, partial [Methanocorpusculum sp.]|nr:hydrogenase expression/formation protein HypE [Methanocorpusculum sp.]
MVKDTEVNMMHGAGGEVMGELLQTLTAFRNNNAGGIGLESLDDGSTFEIGGKTVVLTTDGHVVKPLFFPGGDIGRIAVSGTINDLSVMGARPIALTCGMVIEEGFPIENLRKIVASMDEALGEVGASVITGDTKVVEKGSLDGIAINTAGVGVVEHYLIRDKNLKAGDKIIVSGTIGDHGMAIITYREKFDLGEQLKSDVSPLWKMIEGAIIAGGDNAIHAMKDPTRGGFAACINEMARKAGVKVIIHEEDMPIR